MKTIMMMTVMTVCSSVFVPAFGQENYYVVVSAFSTNGNVKDFTTHLPKFSSDTAYALNDKEKVVRLYVWRTSSKELAASRASALQNDLETNTSSLVGNYESISLANDMDGNMAIVRKDNIIDNSNKISTADLISTASISTTSIANVMSTARTKGSLVKFTITNTDGNALHGHIHNVDFISERELSAYEDNAYIDMSRYAKQKDLSLTCGIFGYKFAEKTIDLSQPSLIADAFLDDKGAWVIPYRLERLQKGDVSVMYNVAFNKDAVIMIGQSKDDLDQLVKMMEENPNYAITIHGHCNGKHSRKIIAMGAEQQFFDINGSQEIYGSAKKLSNLRSQAIKNYLLEHGIGESRIKTYAWGGSYMLAKENSPFSKLNDRIEIEIRKN
jgi:outer membrane protein OmpA-like peptidoglycan-associated protein